MKLLNVIANTVGLVGQLELEGDEGKTGYLKVSFPTVADADCISQFIGKDVRVEDKKIYILDSTKHVAELVG